MSQPTSATGSQRGSGHSGIVASPNPPAAVFQRQSTLQVEDQSDGAGPGIPTLQQRVQNLIVWLRDTVHVGRSDGGTSTSQDVAMVLDSLAALATVAAGQFDDNEEIKKNIDLANAGLSAINSTMHGLHQYAEGKVGNGYYAAGHVVSTGASIGLAVSDYFEEYPHKAQVEMGLTVLKVGAQFPMWRFKPNELSAKGEEYEPEVQQLMTHISYLSDELASQTVSPAPTHRPGTPGNEAGPSGQGVAMAATITSSWGDATIPGAVTTAVPPAVRGPAAGRSPRGR